MHTNGKRGVPRRGPTYCAVPKSARPCCCLAMKRRSRSGVRSRIRGRGQQPKVKTGGTRTGYKVFGLIDYFTGPCFYQGQDGRLNSATYLAFLTRVLAQTTQPTSSVRRGQSIIPAPRPKPSSSSR